MTGWDYDENARTWRPPPGVQPHPHGGQELYGVWDPGDLKATARATAPPGWLLCDGAAVRRDTYPALFTAIGTTYGAGDGTTTFNLPNLKGRCIVMRDAAQVEFDVLGESGGAKTHVLTAAETPAHTHTVNAHNHGARNTDHAHNVYARNQDTGWTSSNHAHAFSTGGNHYAQVWTGTWDHSHQGSGGTTSEQPWGGGNWATNHYHNGHTAGQDANHVHNFNHDHPSTNWQRESGWPGDWNHTHNSESPGTSSVGSGGAHNNLQPYLVMNYLIKT